MNDMARAAALPFLSGETGRTRYLEEIRRFPMLEPQEEFSRSVGASTTTATPRTNLSPVTCSSWSRSPSAIAAMGCRSRT